MGKKKKKARERKQEIIKRERRNKERIKVKGERGGRGREPKSISKMEC